MMPMVMRRVQIMLLVGIVALAGLVLLFALRNRQPPILPTDPDHAGFVDAQRCLSCHNPDGEHPQTKNHPVSRECMRCHGRKRP